MQTVTSLIYEAAGSPPIPGTTLPGQCRTCGAESVGVLFSDWVKDSFNDRDKLHPGTIACAACLFTFSDHNAQLQALIGKEKVQRSRNYSHFVLRGEWIPLSKGDKARMKEILAQAPEVAVIADSGQKHLVFRAQAGWWQFEEQKLLPCPELLKRLLVSVEALYQAGASKGEIDSGRYDQRTIRKVGIEAWRDAETRLTPHRDSSPFKLAIFLAQKEDAE